VNVEGADIDVTGHVGRLHKRQDSVNKKINKLEAAMAADVC
jgi:hypothetical protein